VTDWPVLDLALGLTLVYTSVSLLCSTLNEALASLVGRRAKFMEKWLRGVLTDPNLKDDAEKGLRQFYEHPLIKPLLRKPLIPKPKGERRARARKALGRTPEPATTGRAPSYIPSNTFVSTLLNFAPAVGGTLENVNKRSLDDIKNTFPAGAVRDVAATIIQEVGDDEAAIQKRLEQWYDESMDRVSGWYKRRVQLILAVIGLIAACVLNVDSILIAQTLWSQPNARNAVATQAASYVAKNTKPPTSENFDQAAKDVGQLSALELPLGWNFKHGDLRDRPHSLKAWASKAIGILITTLALLLGAPFWFDLLGKLVSLRGSGPAANAGAGSKPGVAGAT
jgi:hypothetical protein